MMNSKKNGPPSEYQIQKTLCEYLRLNKIIFHSIPNEIAANAIKGKHLKATGLRKGASDLFIAHAHHHFHGMYLELKSERGFVRPEQIEFLRDVEKQNYFTAVAWSIDEAISIINWYKSKPFSWKPEKS